MKKLGQFFQDDNDRFSATRLVMVAWVLGSLLTWGVWSFNVKGDKADKKMPELPSSVQVILGVLLTGKVMQKFGEGSSKSSSSDEPDHTDSTSAAYSDQPDNKKEDTSITSSDEQMSKKGTPTASPNGHVAENGNGASSGMLD